MRTKKHLCALLLFLSTQLIFGQETQSNRRPNIIWIVAEDISPALGCYGDALANTPNIDALASRGLRYEKAYASAPICAPSRSCLVTGIYATSMGTQHLRCEIPFSESLKTLPEYLSAGGYFTTNRNKTDYNFDPAGRWDHWSGSYAPWRHRTDERPFFSFINVGPSHEGSANKRSQYLEATKDIPREILTDPAKVQVPPYYPDTEDSHTVWAHYYDLLHAMDKNVGLILDSLEADGLLDETIIFFFGDHGFGMPRYKRWLYNTGLHVPLIIAAPEKYKDLIPESGQSSTDRLVSFVDYAPSVLNLAGLEIPASMEGKPFLGITSEDPRTEVYAARDRADDMFEMSRAVVDDQYIYIRHFMPHLPYLQPGYIYSDVKEAFRILIDAKNSGLNNSEQDKMWNTKPFEELYDLQSDPHELHNLADDPAMTRIKMNLKTKLFGWMTAYRDLGLLPEAEYMIRSRESTPYDYAKSNAYDVQTILDGARLVGTSDLSLITANLDAKDSGVRYWAVVALMNLDISDKKLQKYLNPMLADPSPSVQIQAAEAICRKLGSTTALNVLGKWVQDDRPWLALQAARSILLIENRAKPIIPDLYKVLEKNLGEPDAPRKYKDFNYAAFTSWALEWALVEMGEDVQLN